MSQITHQSPNPLIEIDPTSIDNEGDTSLENNQITNSNNHLNVMKFKCVEKNLLNLYILFLRLINVTIFLLTAVFNLI